MPRSRKPVKVFVKRWLEQLPRNFSKGFQEQVKPTVREIDVRSGVMDYTLSIVPIETGALQSLYSKRVLNERAASITTTFGYLWNGKAMRTRGNVVPASVRPIFPVRAKETRSFRKIKIGGEAAARAREGRSELFSQYAPKTYIGPYKAMVKHAERDPQEYAVLQHDDPKYQRKRVLGRRWKYFEEPVKERRGLMKAMIIGSVKRVVRGLKNG